MGGSNLKLLLGAGLVSLAAINAAQAGGFARGNADTDILFDDGNFNMRTGVTYVAPHRELSKVPVTGTQKLLGTSYTDSYVVPSVALKINLADNLRCAGTFVQNNGGSSSYDYATVSGKLVEDVATYETAATCGVGLDAGKGRFWLLGGGYVETLDYHRADSYAAYGFGDGALDLSGREYGYRVGAAYEIPEIGLRGQIMYRSGTSYGAEGTATGPMGVFVPGGPDIPITMDAIGTGKLPQSVDLKFQTGIAPGWLAFGSVKWADWSTLTELNVRSSATGQIITTNKYYWRDGWTVTGGVGHAFNDNASGFMSLTWDRGVGTGWDLSSDSYTLAMGGSLKDKFGGELRGGAGFTYLTSAAETKNFGSGGDDRNQAVKAGYALAFNLGYSIKW